MKCRFLLVGWSALALTLAGGGVGASDMPDNEAPVVASQQPSATSHGLRSQSGGSSTLELAPQGGESTPVQLAPQPGSSPATQPSSNTGEQRQFKPSDGGDADQRDFRPHADEPFSPPCLGAVLKYTTKCYRGVEEHGLEVVSLDPSRGAARAGLRGTIPPTPLGIAGGIGGALLGPLELLVVPLLERSGALGAGGDLVLAVDDVRVRDVNEFRKAMRALKPGDSVYLTVIRALPGRGHQTMRIMVNLDSCPTANVVQGPSWQGDNHALIPKGPKLN